MHLYIVLNILTSPVHFPQTFNTSIYYYFINI